MKSKTLWINPHETKSAFTAIKYDRLYFNEDDIVVKQDIKKQYDDHKK